MNYISCIYFEGNETKVTLFSKENGQLKLLRAESLDSSLAFAEKPMAGAAKSNGGKQNEMIKYDFVADDSATFNQNFLQKLNSFFLGIDLNDCKFVPILTEPAIYFQKIVDEKDLASLNINKKGKLEKTIGFVDLYDNSRLAVYPSGKTNYLQAIDSLARLNNKRLLKIPTVKSAEISLAEYVAKKYKLKSSEITLSLYIGKEYSKIIFLKGDKIYHVGSTLSVGKNSFNAHNVLVSKILLEMEHASISIIHNIIISGEDESNELVNTVTEAYPGTRIKRLGLSEIKVERIDKFSSLLSFTIPIVVVEEYLEEISSKKEGINLLPKYIKEQQKIFQFGWSSYIMMLLIFASAFYFSYTYVANQQRIKKLIMKLRRLNYFKHKTRKLLIKLKAMKIKFKMWIKPEQLLPSYQAEQVVLSLNIKKIADFVEQKRNMWINNIDLSANKDLKISGYTLFRPLARQLNDSYNSAILNNVNI